MNSEELKARLDEVREELDSTHARRLQRAISWLECAEKYSETDEDMSFIALWVAFNSLYYIDETETKKFRDDFKAYAEKLIRLDNGRRIYNCLWKNFSQFVRSLIDNEYVYENFWRCRRTGEKWWEGEFEKNKREARRALETNEVTTLLGIIVMERLYVLRNQLVHGGATWQGDTNRDQVRDGKRMLMELVPVFIELMFDGSEDWGAVPYPNYKEDDVEAESA